MSSSKAKGNYYQKKTKDWFEMEGYTVYIMENKRSIFLPKTGRVIYQTYDIAGCDLMAMNGKEILFIQVKLGDKNIAQGIKEFYNHPYPKDAKRIVVQWFPRVKEPTIHEVKESV